MRALIVIPCLNEIAHIKPLLQQLLPFVTQNGGQIVVADGGSTDGTRDVVAGMAEQHEQIILLDNPKRIQSAGINLAVDRFGADHDVLIRIDAHSAYPEDYCAILLEEAKATGAASVVVGMVAEGAGLVQGANAAVQNSPLGTGGSKHRACPTGDYVVHGHHALMQIAAFRQVGGYDERFSHNEDAELDWRLVQAGHQIWLTNKTFVTYFPRKSMDALARQYFNYGKGRARTMLKHRMKPQARQLIVVMVVPCLLLMVLTPITMLAALPALIWLVACLLGGVYIAVQHVSAALILTGVSAAVMHAAWSAGFWWRLLQTATGCDPVQTVGAQ
ncbi:glycosyltransferase family 2 protein [Pseudaestuariivita rosea]|uniref:glycosyltransferase family 2 protein n=1 Tax=Pseudaestuariivita rosea TaxID=2763263 RepID=UPI001ABB2473|nr:glycosyltransferase family 2 protein [Pseudaestuariivita rosea]